MQFTVIKPLAALLLIACYLDHAIGENAQNQLAADKTFKVLVEEAFPEGNVIIGGTFHHRRMNDTCGAIVAEEFNYLTPANAFKQTYIHPEPGVYLYDNPDDFVTYSRKNNMLMRLHAPISPQCSAWAKDDARTADELIPNLEEYLVALYKRYAGLPNVRWLDVVNETIEAESGEWMMPKPGTDTWENPWPRIGFDETDPLRPPLYIKQAFEVANRYAPNQKLIINQHGQLEQVGWEKMKALVGYLRRQGLRVDGIGWQAHVYMGWEKQDGNVQRLGELIRWCHANNLEFHITEFNVYLRENDKDKLEQQADTFEAITKTVLDNQKSGFVGINFWHMANGETQKKLQGCLFDQDHRPMPAYFRLKKLLSSYSGNE